MHQNKQETQDQGRGGEVIRVTVRTNTSQKGTKIYSRSRGYQHTTHKKHTRKVNRKGGKRAFLGRGEEGGPVTNPACPSH